MVEEFHEGRLVDRLNVLLEEEVGLGIEDDVRNALTTFVIDGEARLRSDAERMLTARRVDFEQLGAAENLIFEGAERKLRMFIQTAVDAAREQGQERVTLDSFQTAAFKLCPLWPFCS